MDITNQINRSKLSRSKKKYKKSSVLKSKENIDLEDFEGF